jgi:hypothetical protein
MSTSTKFNGVTLKMPATRKARRQEAPFLIRALTADSAAEANTAVNEGRTYIERSRGIALEVSRKKK